jgi:hypothetical protein
VIEERGALQADRCRHVLEPRCDEATAREMVLGRGEDRRSGALCFGDQLGNGCVRRTK